MSIGSQRTTTRHRALAALALLAAAGAAHAQVNRPTDRVFLQWWENRWTDMEHRAPDFFMAGYRGLWLPPVHKAASANSVGYDPFDRFDLGRPGATTAYGTEQEFRAMLGELQTADAYATVDIVMNHNSGRTTDRNFWLSGGYPGFWGGGVPTSGNKLASDNWGDFHNNPSGGCCTFLQSENPGGANYNLLNGDLVALIDIAHENNNRFVRHPIDTNQVREIDSTGQLTGALRPAIPAGTSVNIPNPINRMFYQDLSLPPRIFTNPGTARNPGVQNLRIYPFNTSNPMNGTPIPENQNDMLARWTQWMLDVYKVDGFRIDAIKHTPSWFFDNIWDNVVNLRRTTPWGTQETPFSYGESVESNSFTLNNYVRLDSFANRDALDLNGAGQLRNLIGGTGSWGNVVPAHLDNADDGLNNGTLGVQHTFSHDNGSVGNGSSQPPIPTPRQQGFMINAYMIMKNSVPLVYHNARGISRPGGGFWPREGNPTALFIDPTTNLVDDRISTLVQLRNQFGRGDWRPLNPSNDWNDVLIYERFRINSQSDFKANVLVGINDRYDGGFDTRTITTSFPQGTILREYTGNAANPTVDPTNAIPDRVVVGAGGSVTIAVPRNLNSSNTETNRGFVVYGPVLPDATVAVSPIASTIAPDSNAFTPARRRITPVPVITAPTFSLSVNTTNGDVGQASPDPAMDDRAIYRIDKGFFDSNGNGFVDNGPTAGVAAGHEEFLTVNQPQVNNPAPVASRTGSYSQSINTSTLSEGYHYISVKVFKQRPANTDPIFREVRQVIYVDRLPPQFSMRSVSQPLPVTTTQFEFAFDLLDRTTNVMYMMSNLPPGTDPLSQLTIDSLGRRVDRFQWNKTLPLVPGLNTITVVAIEDSGNVNVQTFPIQVGPIQQPCYANCDGSTDVPVLGPADFSCFLSRFRAGDAYGNCDGSTDVPVLGPSDFSCFLSRFRAGC